MKQPAKTIGIGLMIVALTMLGGCGGYARTQGSGSGVEMYGTVDVGVQHGVR